MSISTGLKYLPYGVTKFNKLTTRERCGLQTSWCQQVESADTLTFQFEAGVINEVVVGGDLNTQADLDNWVGANWVLDTNIGTGATGAKHIPTNLSPLLQAAILTVTDIYEVVIVLTEVTVGTITIRSTEEPVLTKTGTFTRYITANQVDLVLAPSGDFDGKIDSVSVKRMGDQFTFNFIDSAGAIDATFDETSGNVARSGKFVTVSLLWSSLSLTNDCYNIQILDDDFIINDQFDELGTWVLQANIAVALGLLTFSAAAPVTRTATLPNVLESGCSYSIRFSLTTIDPTLTVTPIAGGTSGTVRAVAGTFTETILSAGTDFVFSFSSGAIGAASITFLDITKLCVDGTSECFQLSTDFLCTKKFTWSNDEEGLYTAGLQHELRLECNLKHPSYASTKLFGANSAGLKPLDYSSFRKRKQLGVSLAHEYIMDAITGWANSDNATIDGTRYVSEEDVEPTQRGGSDRMYLTLEIEEENQPNLVNNNES